MIVPFTYNKLPLTAEIEISESEEEVGFHGEVTVNKLFYQGEEITKLIDALQFDWTLITEAIADKL